MLWACQLRVIGRSPRPGASGSLSSTTMICGLRGSYADFSIPLAQTDGARWACSAALVVTRATDILQYSPAPEPETIAPELLRRNAIPGGCSNVVAETTLVREVGGFDTELSLLADWDLWIRLALAAPAAVIPGAARRLRSPPS